MYFIWSIEHNAWWKPQSLGYTRNIREAGMYEEAQAKQIVKMANRGDSFNECMIPAYAVIDRSGAYVTEK